MNNAIQWVKENPYVAVGLGVVLVLVFAAVSKAAGGAGTSSTADLSAMSLQTSADLQAANLANQSQAQTLAATVAVQQAQAGLNAASVQAGAQVQISQNNVVGQVALASIEAELYDHVLRAQSDQSAANIALESQAVAAQAAQSKQVLNLVSSVGLNHEGSKQQGIVNVVALGLGQGNVSSYNAATATASAAASQSSAAIWQAIISGATKITTAALA